MHTAHFSGRLEGGGVVATGGGCLSGGCLPGGCLPRGCARLGGVCPEGSLPRGCLPRGWGCLPRGCLSKGYVARGSLPRECTPPQEDTLPGQTNLPCLLGYIPPRPLHVGIHPSPVAEGMTHACKNFVCGR